jgi:hypothetical protein
MAAAEIIVQFRLYAGLPRIRLFESNYWHCLSRCESGAIKAVPAKATEIYE